LQYSHVGQLAPLDFYKYLLHNPSLVVKVGTKVKGIRLVDGDHDIYCKIPGVGAMKLKSQFVKKQ
jgi:alkylphosphonate utilization operon protein PhnA